PALTTPFRSGEATSAAGPTVFRTPAQQRYLSLFAIVILGAATAFLLGVAVLILFAGQWVPVLVMAAIASFVAGLVGYVARDFRGKWGLRVVLDAEKMVLDLP